MGSDVAVMMERFPGAADYLPGKFVTLSNSKASAAALEDDASEKDATAAPTVVVASISAESKGKAPAAAPTIMVASGPNQPKGPLQRYLDPKPP